MAKVEEILLNRDIVKCVEENLEVLTGQSVRVSTEARRKIKPEKVISLFSKNEIVVVVYSNLIFSRKIYVTMIFDVKNACVLSRTLLAQADLEIGGEEIIDSLREFGNIMIGTIASYISMIQNERVDYTIPEVVIDYDTAIMESLIMPLAMNNEFIDLYEFSVMHKATTAKSMFKMFILPGEA